MDSLNDQLIQKLKGLGLDLIGVIPAAPGRRLDAYLRWVAAEMYGRMHYLARPDRLERRQDLNVILPGVKTIISVGLNYHTLQLPDSVANDLSRGRISNYAWGLDYHDILTPRLQELADWLDSETGSASKVYVDTGAILERDHAESAGLGFTGKNTMLIHPQRGSYFFLGEILTTAGLPPSTFRLPPSCGSCHRCLDACPTNAFPESYVLDARRCISYLTIELKGWIPVELRPLMGNWVYGCDICQAVCPFNRFATPTAEAAFYPAGQKGNSSFTIHHSSFDVVAPPLLDLLALDEDAFNERFAGSPIKRIKRARLVRNACVAAGNWGSETAVPSLITLLTDPEPVIRGHAAWALKQIGTAETVTAVTHALIYETDPDVRRELTG
ncbi:MAG: tRNA epoxyqueuosine(34) reductase QueG [Ardenticatenaceae bacterium]|nr:tRNA epoxyqueuosine(34) reductase QueG [Ardenticatenaceae bacterium]MCB9443600.1 tRNA epoxyqueuosine(34) reductase QueG [Ardenticatenaceae bacterium]